MRRRHNHNKERAAGLLTFLSSTMAEWRKSGEKYPQLASYSFDGENLKFEWRRKNDNPTGLGNHWVRLELQNSERLRIIDPMINPRMLTEAWFKGDGLLLIPDKEITDLTVSAKRIIHHLSDGSHYSINREYYPFLRHITPDEPVIIYNDTSDGELYIH